MHEVSLHILDWEKKVMSSTESKTVAAIRESDSDKPAEAETAPKYRMTVSLNVLYHLGIGLYSNIPAVLSELVANAWDADATEVDITIKPNERIIVEDNGHGMTLEDINDRFLNVGYQRREHTGQSPNGRDVMGRKGIGKLSSFSIANLVEVHSLKDGDRNALRMDRAKIEKEIKDKRRGEYNPEDIDASIDGEGHGTKIVLSELDKRTHLTAPYLRKRLARRFSIIGSANQFKVTINAEEVTPQDRDFYDKLEYVWRFGSGSDTSNMGKLKKTSEIGSTVTVPGEDGDDPNEYEVTGWIGTVDLPESLDDVNNSIVLLARGKLVHENLLPEFKEAGMYAQYVIGEVNADFLDDDRADIVTSDRQSIKEDDNRYEALYEFVHAALKTIKNQWTTLRAEEATDRALTYPSVLRWYERLGPDGKRTAERMFAKIESLRLQDVETKKEIYRSTILAFEKLALHDLLSVLDEIESADAFETLSRLMIGVEEVESFHYHEVSRGRLQVIRQFKDLVDKNVLEKVLQKFIFKELWLLHPSWERAATNSRIEESVTQEFRNVDAKLTEEEKKGRIDIRYKTAAGKHVIIELKKYDRTVKATELIEQLQKYRDALDKCLRTKFPEQPRQIELISILGKPPSGSSEQENLRLLSAINARYITYDQLVFEAERSYREYLEKDSKITELIEIVNNLEHDFKAGSAEES